MTVDTRTRNRNRGLLIAIFVMFFGSMLVAGLLRFSGWRPAGTQNHGELLQPPGDLREVIYVDHFGNVMTGLRAGALVPGCTLRVKGRAIAHGRVFSEMPPGQPFWYENSLGLVELAANGASTQRALGIVVGDPIG